jgi:hypothetical protein
MATVTTLARAAGGVGNPNRKPYLVEKEIDFAAAATAKGSALAAADVIEAISVPAGTMVINAGLQVVTANVGGSNDVALDLGVTGVDADVFVDGFDYDAAAAGDYAQNAAAFQPVVIGAADTIDLLIQAATTAPTGGKVRVWALLMGVGAVGVTEAAVADRDQLA